MKKRTLSELQAREEKVIENLKIERQNLQIVQNRKNTLTKNAVTRRLCNHGRLGVFAVYSGNRYLIIRCKFEEFLQKTSSI